MKVGFTCSTFDLFHAGHLLMLEEAKKQCDYLIVGLQTDPTIDRPTEKNKPVQSVFERFVQLEACKYVDKVIPYATEKELVDILLSYPINVRILGDEYAEKEFTGKWECINHGIEFYYNRREHSFSTSELRQRVVAAEVEKGLKNE
jgi:glycerol-3-phosphate cytidylyltransferase